MKVRGKSLRAIQRATELAKFPDTYHVSRESGKFPT